jgi:hypothetical protein
LQPAWYIASTVWIPIVLVCSMHLRLLSMQLRLLSMQLRLLWCLCPLTSRQLSLVCPLNLA